MARSAATGSRANYFRTGAGVVGTAFGAVELLFDALFCAGRVLRRECSA